MSEKLTEDTLVTCPFCSDADFDLIGLKYHLLNGWCEVFEQTQPIIAELVGATHG